MTPRAVINLARKARLSCFARWAACPEAGPTAAVAQTSSRPVHSLLRRSSDFDDDNDFPGPTIRHAHPRPESPAASAAAVAARLSKQEICPLDVGTPRYLNSALDPSTTQARVVLENKAPWRVVWTSPAWQTLVGSNDAVGQPGLAALLSAMTNQGEVSSLLEALHSCQRGCATAYCQRAGGVTSAFPARITLSPLMADGGHTTHMLLVARPLPVS